MLHKTYAVQGLFTGKKETLPNGQESAIRKKPTQTHILKSHRIQDDTVVDQRFHGGDMRVLHHYSEKNYQHLKKKFPEIAERFIPGSFGENLYTNELSENDLCIGDIFNLGSAKIQLTVPRRPCATLNNSYEDKRILKEVINCGHVGWFYRILEEGEVKISDHLTALERPFPNLKITKLFEQGYGKEKFKDLGFLKACYETGLMDKGWKPKLEKVLKILT